MWFDMRKGDLGFVERAPVVHVAEADVPAPRPVVFAAFAEPRSWTHWFPNVRTASYTSPPPHGVGTIREAHVGGTHWVEEMIAWDEGTRLAWTVTRASVPFATTQVEVFEFCTTGSGTRVRWTLALEPRLLARLGAPLAPRIIARMLQRATQNLGTYVQRASPGPIGQAAAQ